MNNTQVQFDWMNKMAIIETVSKFAYYADHRQWEDLQQLFTEEVKVDYTSLAGGEPVTIPANVLMDSWNKVLTPLKATQHLISNHIIDFDNEHQATCRAYFQAQHEFPNPFGGSQWTLGGKYLFLFVKENTQWKISELVMTAVWANGNQNIMNLASQQLNI
ncbi:nuclear transport factor 2 family protein [Paenibacillus andongensis]|uniref:nuclear transport factor 2 family protein n=1 Tax=Paenibacillus andongensis TaxID=2975482 RepID=UPI0021BB374E|nr:nuclear transport factor 2 family protein [Paenibacillus andongensis]